MKSLFAKTALVLFLLTCLMPPWVKTYDKNGESGSHSRQSIGHDFVLTPPQVNENTMGIKIDFPTLLIEWIGLACFAAAPVIWKKLKP
jgi:hypothetical protein